MPHLCCWQQTQCVGRKAGHGHQGRGGMGAAQHRGRRGCPEGLRERQDNGKGVNRQDQGPAACERAGNCGSCHPAGPAALACGAGWRPGARFNCLLAAVQAERWRACGRWRHERAGSRVIACQTYPHGRIEQRQARQHQAQHCHQPGDMSDTPGGASAPPTRHGLAVLLSLSAGEGFVHTGEVLVGRNRQGEAGRGLLSRPGSWDTGRCGCSYARHPPIRRGRPGRKSSRKTSAARSCRAGAPRHCLLAVLMLDGTRARELKLLPSTLITQRAATRGVPVATLLAASSPACAPSDKLHAHVQWFVGACTHALLRAGCCQTNSLLLGTAHARVDFPRSRGGACRTAWTQRVFAAPCQLMTAHQTGQPRRWQCTRLREAM